MLSARSPRSSGFSLVEVALAIGIVAFAFVALLGLIPTGLNTFREAIDKTNETIIVQDLNSMIQVTDWSKVNDLDFQKSQEEYYYNDEGRFVDTKSNKTGTIGPMIARLYGAKIIIEPFKRPEAGQNEYIASARRVTIVIANITQPPAKAAFDAVVNGATAGFIPTGVSVSAHSFVINQMDSSIASN